ncbi:hypothetical protein BDW75DRAFT_248584 [Aspergillus navahoensis]
MFFSTHLQVKMTKSDRTIGWQQVRDYKDHIGHPAVLEEYIQDYEPDPSHVVPIQIYSAASLDADHENPRAYLPQGSYSDEVLPLFEVYSFRPSDAFACIEHYRREIACREAQHPLGAPNPPPLIPQFFNESREKPVGRLSFLWSHSYRLGSVGDWDLYTEAGDAPDQVNFNGSFSRSQTHVEQVQRREDADNELGLAGFELSGERVQCQTDVAQYIMGDIFPNSQHLELEYALNDEAKIRQQLERQLTGVNYTLNSTFRILEDDDTGVVTITHATEGDEPDLQYLIYAPFLSHLRNPPHSSIPLLKGTARLFSSSLLSHLPSQHTIRFIFSIPGSRPWSSIYPAHSHLLNSLAPPFPIGARHAIPIAGSSTEIYRIYSQHQSDTISAAKRMLASPYRIFAVGLDQPDFVDEAGVYFYTSEHTPSGNLPGEAQPHPDDTEVWRVVGMREVSRLQGMVGVREGVVE